MRSERFLCYIVAILIGGCFHLEKETISTQPSEVGINIVELDVAIIGFGEVIDDDKILELLKRYEVIPRAVFHWAKGWGGTYRSYEELKSAEEFLRTARTKSIQGMERGHEADILSLHNLVEGKQEEETIASDLFQKEGLSLVHRWTIWEKILQGLKEGGHFFYAVEVVGHAEQLESLRRDERVKELVLLPRVMQKGMRARIPRPKAYKDREPYIDQEIMAMSNHELYLRIIEILGKTKQENGETNENNR